MAPERHVADAAYGLTGRVAATLVDESTLSDGQRLHDAANRSRAADVAGQGRIGRSGSTRRFATVVVSRVAARSGGARDDLTDATDEADCPGDGVGNGVVTLTGSAGSLTSAACWRASGVGPSSLVT